MISKSFFKELSRLDSYGDYGQGAHPGVQRRDNTSLGIFVEQQLRHLIPQVYHRRYPDLDARAHTPPGPPISPWAMSWGYKRQDVRGRAKIASGQATDIPRVGAEAEVINHPIRMLVIAYGWSIEEIEAAAGNGIQLSSTLANAARRAIAELEHQIILLGDAPNRLPGFLVDPDLQRITVPNGDWAGATTPDQILADMNSVIDVIFERSKRIHRPDTMLMTVSAYRIVQSTRVPDTGVTIMELFLRNNGHVKTIQTCLELDTVADGAPAFLCYQKSSDNAFHVVPLEFDQQPPQLKDFSTVIPCRSRCGGAVWQYPMSGALADGI